MPAVTIHLASPSGRVCLLPITRSDDARIAELRTHPATRQFQPYFPTTMSAADARYMHEMGDTSSFSLTQFKIEYIDRDIGLEEAKFAGSIGFWKHALDLANNSCSLYLMVSPEMHRNGVGIEALYLLLEYAFEVEKLHRVAFMTASDNLGSCFAQFHSSDIH